jgi:tRNA A37 methylthiotransferase MiaB
MIELAKQMRHKAFESFIGRKTDVLLEKPVEGSSGDMEGLTPNYIPVKVKIRSQKTGEIINIRLVSCEGEYMRGDLL